MSISDENVSLHLPPGPRLESSDQWLDWFFTLRSKALSLGIWDKMDPYEPDKSDDELAFPLFEDCQQLRDRLIREAHQDNQPAPTDANIITMLALQARDAEIKLAIYQQRAAKEQAIRVLIMETVGPNIYEAAMNTLDARHTLRQHVKSIQKIFAPELRFFQWEIVDAYRAVLAETQDENCEPEAWLHRWRKAFTRVEEFSPSTVRDYAGVRDFLKAIAVLVEPEWLSVMVGEYVCPSNSDTKKTNVHTISQRFFYHITSLLLPYNKPGSSSTERPEASENKAIMSCPCGLKKHRWEPEDCGVLEFVIRGSTDRKIKRPTIKKQNDILNEIWKDKWEELRLRLEQKGWDILTPGATFTW